MSCDPIDLASGGCWNCLTPDQKLTAELNLLCQILQALDPMAECNPITLAGDGCAACLMPSQKQTAIYALVCAVFEAIDGGALGQTCCYSGNGDPNGVVAAAIPAIYVQLDAPGRIWAKVADDGGNTGWSLNS